MSDQTPKTRAVVFDLDDTLYAERDYVRSGYRAVGEHLRRSQAAIEDQDPAGWLWDRFLSGRTDGAFDALSEHFALGLSESQIGELVEVYRSHRPDISPREGIDRLLDGLAGRKRLGLLTDGFLPAQQLKFDALGLADYFDAVIFTESLGPDRKYWKPSPEGFEITAERLAVSHRACCYVADNPAKDFVAPNALGWRTIQLLLPEQVHSHKPAPEGGEAQTVVRSVEELRDELVAY